MTDKGKKRAKGLCRAVGVLVSVEIDIEDPTTNKITINLYDKDVMPLVDELYQADATNQLSRVKGERMDDGDEGVPLISHTTDYVFKDYISTIEAEIDSFLLEEVGAKHNNGGSLKKEAQTDHMMMMEVFNQCQAEAAELIQDDEDEEKDENEDAVQTTTLAQELMNMMSEKENSSSVNIIGSNEQFKQAPPLLPSLKNEVAFPKQCGFSTNVLKSDPTFTPDLECEVILYVDNREKKNQ